MKASPLLVSWHNEQQPIYSVHFDPHSKLDRVQRLATAGADNNIRIWHLTRDENTLEAKVDFRATLVRHTQTVNVVRFCPKGEVLASAGDDGNVLLWIPSDVPMTQLGREEDHAEDKEYWRVKCMCRTSTGAEIYDLAWSPDGRYFITGSMDNTARIFDAQSGAMIRQIAEHNHYVQGVAWDPLNEFVATQSSDRSLHIYALKLKDGTCTLSTHGKFSKMDLPGRRVSQATPAPLELHRGSNASASGLAIASPAPSNPGTPMTTPLPMDPPITASSRRSSFGSSPAIRRSNSPAPNLPLPAVRPEISSPSLNAAMGLAVRNASIYHNETLTSFFRRLTFAPDGSLLFTPSGQYKQIHPHQSLHLDPIARRQDEEITNTVYIYTRAGFNKPPVAHLPGHKTASIAVRCSPVFYTLRSHTKPTANITIDSSSAGESIPPLPEAIGPTEMQPPSLLSHPSSEGAHRPTSSPRPQPADEQPLPSMFALPYRIVYAVATRDAVLIYDTQQSIPLCVVSNLHYATFTDLAWSNDGTTLMMSSSDGFCSTLTFSPGELGDLYTGKHPTYKHPDPVNIAAANSDQRASGSTPLSAGLGSPAAGMMPSPSFSKVLPVPASRHDSNASNVGMSPFPALPPEKSTPGPMAAPSPAPSSASMSFAIRPGSPARSNSQSSVVTLASSHIVPEGSVPAPMMSNIPGVAVPSNMTTPPATPMYHSASISYQGGHRSQTPSISGSVLGKRDVGAQSESEREDGRSSMPQPVQNKKRRIAPTQVGNGTTPDKPESTS